jgi:hypothetical protein
VHVAAAAHAILGDASRSVALLRKAASIGLPSYTAFRDDPHFDSLHQYQPFLRVMQALRKQCAGYERECLVRLSPQPCIGHFACACWPLLICVPFPINSLRSSVACPPYRLRVANSSTKATPAAAISSNGFSEQYFSIHA